MTVKDTAGQEYRYWINKHAIGGVTASDHQRRQQSVWPKMPLFEFIFCPRSGQESLLAHTLASLTQQAYAHWQVTVFADTPAPAHFTHSAQSTWVQTSDIERVGAIDARLQQSKADWIGFIESGTQLSPDALLHLGDYSAVHPDWRVMYCDEDCLNDVVPNAENRLAPLLKPDFNADFFYSSDYIGDVWIERVALLAAGAYSACSGAEKYELVLRQLERAGEHAIGHIAAILLHVPSAVFARAGGEAATKALEQHLVRRKINAEVRAGLIPGKTRHVHYRHAGEPKVSIIIPTRNRLDLLGACIESLLRKTRYANWEVLVVDNASDDPNVPAYYKALQEMLPGRIQIVPFAGPFDYSAMNNEAARLASGDYLLLLNNDIVCIQEDWLDAMLAHAQRPDVGVVGARLLFPGSLNIQHAGCVLGMNNTSDHVFFKQPYTAPGYLQRALVDQEYSAVTGACLMIRASLFNAIGGLRQAVYKIYCSDIDLCLQAREHGFRVIWTPFASLLHHSSASLKSSMQHSDMRNALGDEQDDFLQRWRTAIREDRFWNKRLSLATPNGDFEHDLEPSWNTDFADRPRVLVMPIATPGITEYRQEAPLRALHQQGKIHYSMLLPPLQGYERTPDITEMMRMAPNTVLMHAPVDDKRCFALTNYQKQIPEILRVYSLDDLIDNMPEDNAFRKALPPDLMRQRLQIGLAASNRLIVSTEPLAAAYWDFIDDIRIVPNSLDPAIWGTLRSQRRRGAKIRVGWAGAQQHAGDLRFLREVIEATHREVDWVFMGQVPEGVAQLICEEHEFERNFYAYPAKLAALDLDLAIAPLAIHPFNEAKSNLKLLEYGILGWPVIATDIYPYQKDNPPITRLANQTASWIAAIKARIGQFDTLAQEGDALQNWVKQNYLLTHHLEHWHKALLR